MEHTKSSPNLMLLMVLAGIIFSIGFATGWYFSQQSAKRAFRAAIEQQSLESSNPKKQSEQPQQPPVAPPQVTPAAAPTQQPQQAAPTGQVPLSFFETLPKGQKQAVLGSGINEKPKPAQPAATQPPQTVKTPLKTADAKSAGSAGYLVQVAAFNSSKEAENAKTKLSAKGYSATVVEINLNDKGTWYRVRIGRHLDKEAASEIVNRLGGSAKVLPDQE
jgi:cell division protein FtsN